MTDNGDHNRNEKPADLQELRVRRDSPVPGSRDAFLELKNSLCAEVLARRTPDVDLTDIRQARPFVHDHLDALLEERGIVLNRAEKRQLLEAIVADLTNSKG